MIKILSLRKRVAEHKHELELIAIQIFVIILVILAVIGTLVFFYLLNDSINVYIFRILKLILYGVNIGLTYAAFIKPSIAQ